jgi:hypothetical protein
MMAKFVNMAKEIAMKTSIYNMIITAMVQGSDDASAVPCLRVGSYNRASMREALRIDLVVYNIGFGNKNG